MLLDKQIFRIGREFGAHCSVIADEVARLRPDHFVDWPDRDAYSAGWRVLPLCIDQCPDGWSPDLDGNRRLMPRTWEIVRAWPEILTCGVSRLMPGCHIFSHCDRVQPDTYRYHLCLRVPGLAGLRAGTEQIECQTGLAYVFDHRERHEAANLADAPRDVLLVDFVATPAELAALRTWRSARGGAGAAG